MKGLAPLFLGIFGTFAFSWIGLTVIPNWQIGHLNPQSDEEGTDIYPQPQSGMFERGARVYAANGCIYCHSQQVRADYAADDIERKWGDRRSAPRDYIFDRPVFLGKMRMGQDLANIGARAPAPEESPSPAGVASPAAAPATQGTAAGSPSAAPANSPSSARSPGNGACRFRSAEFSFRFACCEYITAARATHRCRFTFPWANGERYSGRKQSGGTNRANSRRAVADPDRGFAADVLCCLASRASVFATQHQSRFEHALLPVSLSEAAHHRRAFGGCIATLRFGCATGRLGDCSDVRCKMSGCLFDGAKSIPSVERRQIHRRRTGSCPITTDSGCGRFTRSSSRCIACRSKKITQ